MSEECFHFVIVNEAIKSQVEGSIKTTVLEKLAALALFIQTLCPFLPDYQQAFFTKNVLMDLLGSEIKKMNGFSCR